MHAPGWIELYELLEGGRVPSPALVELCKAGRSAASETMVHWYAIEGTPEIVCRLIELGFDFQEPNLFGASPLQSAAIGQRWGVVRVLRGAGASVLGVSGSGETYRSALRAAGEALPEDLRGDLYQLEDLALAGGPEPEAVASVVLLCAGSEGQALDHDSWSRFAAHDPALSFDPDEPESTLVMDPCGETAGVCEWDAGGRTLTFYAPAAAGLKLAYRAGQHFGAELARKNHHPRSSGGNFPA